MLHRLLLCLSLLLSAPAAGASDADFTKTFGDDWLAEYWQFNPDYAISVGYYAVAAELPAPTEANRKRYQDWLSTQLKALKGFNPDRLSPVARSDWAILKTQLEAEAWTLDTLKSWQWNPSIYNVAEPIAILLSTPYAAEPDRLRTVKQRLLQVPAYYAAAKSAISHPTREHTQLAIQQNSGALEVLGESLEKQLADAKLSAAERKAFLDALKPARAALTDYIAWLQQLEAQQEKAGTARSFRLGEALYEQKFAYDIQSGSTAKALYERALQEKEALHARMAVLADQLWPKYFPGSKQPADRIEKIARMIANLSERHVSREGFVDEVKRQIPLLEAFVRKHDLVTQDASRPLEVRLTPAYQRGFSIASINAPGPYDPTAKTFYNVSPLDDYTPEQAESFLREYNHWQLQVLNIHEAVPGHYVQLLHANKSPSRIKTLFGNGAMVEGWAVYAEKMMLEAGWGGSEPELELIHGKWLLRVTSNTIIDYGIHVLGWNEQQVLDLIRNEAFQSETEARGKWRRATLSQVQLTSYFAGYSAIYDFRARLKKALGERFDLKRFHEAFLSYGSAPVVVIESLMKVEDAAR
ncbi:MAG: DUF885 domain-containing protein [Pseudomonadota bacterium]|nr:DUF885 domain-containing protein [Pseudomonadota bacterium]